MIFGVIIAAVSLCLVVIKAPSGVYDVLVISGCILALAGLGLNLSLRIDELSDIVEELKNK